MRTAWGYLANYRGAIIGGVVMLIATNALFVGIPVTTGMTIDALRGADPAGEVPRLVVAMVLFALGTAITRILSRVWIFNAARGAEYELRSDLFRHLLGLDLPYYRAHPTGDVMSRLTNDVQTVRAMWGAGILNIVNTLVAFATVLVMMLRIDPWLTLWACLPYPAMIAAGRVFGRRVYKTSQAVQAQLGSLSNEIQEDLTSIQAIKTYGLEDTRRGRFTESSQRLLERNMALTRVRGQMGPMFAAFASLSTVAVLWVGGRLVMRGAIELGQLVEMTGYLARLVWPTLALGWMLSLLQRGRASWSRLETLLATAPSIVDGPGPSLPPGQRQGGLELKGLTVAIGGRTILDGVSFTVPAGTTTAIVGRTGSGKSTLCEAVCRLLDVAPGAIWLDGRDITSLPLADLRGAIGYAPQEAFLFSTTIADNIAFGFGAGSSLPRARADELERVTGAGAPQIAPPAFIHGEPDPRIVAAAEAAGLTRDLAVMPEGFATVVGERGITLSGGQRQRVALARAIAADPRLLILDDSLSSVDAETERIILDRLAAVLRDRTAILVSHRVAAVKNAHQIVVLDDGKVAEVGRHAELLARGGVYAELYRTQLAAGAPAGAGAEPTAATAPTREVG
ncbi:MAG TPA: ABC transporter ATP-binding protein [Kofleriaceae bacterium]|nr:ABC transporter ATP-binding protein [Kofleriaceae bacterium]